MSYKAVSFGTNYIGTGNDLSECVHDAFTMTSLFEDIGFSVNIYTEDEVTLYRFRQNLINLVDLAVRWEITGAAISHSGHGTKGYDPTEPDFYKEGLYFEDGILWDKEMAQILSRIPEGFPFFIFLDTCFSGGMMRKIGGPKPRFIHTEIIPVHAKARGGFREAISNNAVYISACSEGEYSYDASALGNGAATYYLNETFRNNISFREWINKIQLYLPDNEYPQTPLLICKEELKDKRVPLWFAPVATNIPDIPSSLPWPEIPQVKLSFWKRFLNWLLKLFN